jgi:hypothetical protein
MAVANAAQAPVKSAGDPNTVYETLKPLWEKSRAACSGERFVKDFDENIDNIGFTNLLIPFSPSMTQEQYNFYKAEAEWPGITAQFSKMLVGGLLRKPPRLTFKKDVPEEAKNWILNEFGKDGCSLVAFLDEGLSEEIKTSRPWVFVDYPKIDNPDDLDEEELKKYTPYPVLQPGESVVNWRVTTDEYGKCRLDRVIVRGLKESYVENEFHPTFIDVAYVHELVNGKYQVRVFEKTTPESNVPVNTGQVQQDVKSTTDTIFVLKQTNSVLVNGDSLDFIPAWPLNGCISPREPILLPIIDKEVALYNKVSRRNHLLYGASTYTPVIFSDMTDEEFDEVVGGGLGTWLHLNKDDAAEVLETPTAALQDMEKAIAAAIEEMAKLGIRMLTPEVEQSGVALEIRNAAQTAQLSTLNTKVSETMRQVIVFMINWRYELKLTIDDVEFSLSDDFNPAPLGADWLRLATEWYQAGLVPRAVWITLLKLNDLLPPDYDDDEGKKEISADEIIQNALRGSDDYATQIANGRTKKKE